MNRSEITVAAILSAFLTLFLVGPLRFAFGQWFIVGRTFSSSVMWFDPIAFWYWLFALGWSFLLGALFAWIYARHWLSVSIACGIAASVVRMIWVSHHFAPDAPWSTPIWSYGEEIIPLFGAAAGGTLIHLISRRRPNSAT